MRSRAALFVTLGVIFVATPAAFAQTSHRRHSQQPAANAPAEQASAPAQTEPAAAPAAAPPAHHAAQPAAPVANQSVWDQPGHHPTGLEFDLFAFAVPTSWAWAYGGVAFGPGVRVNIPLISNGPISGHNNDLRLSAGAMLFLWPDVTKPLGLFAWLGSTLALQWNFYLTSRWSVFAEAGILFDYYPDNHPNCYDHPMYYCDTFLFHPLGGAGAIFHSLNASGYPAVTIRFEYPTGLDVGLTF